jgi:hypothetical protein
MDWRCVDWIHVAQDRNLSPGKSWLAEWLLASQEGFCPMELQWMQNNSELGLRHAKRGREVGKIKGEQYGKESVWACTLLLKILFPFNFDTIGGISMHWLSATLYFVDQRNYKTVAMQAHALTCTRYFCSLNVIISHPIARKEGLGHFSACCVGRRSSPPYHLCVCNCHPSSELFCVRCSYEDFIDTEIRHEDND